MAARRASQQGGSRPALTAGGPTPAVATRQQRNRRWVRLATRRRKKTWKSTRGVRAAGRLGVSMAAVRGLGRTLESRVPRRPQIGGGAPGQLTWWQSTSTDSLRPHPGGGNPAAAQQSQGQTDNQKTKENSEGKKVERRVTAESMAPTNCVLASPNSRSLASAAVPRSF